MSSQDPTADLEPTPAAAIAEPPPPPPVATGTATPPSPLRPFLPLLYWLAFVAIALVANSGALRGDGFLWTDRALVADNQFLRSLGGLQRIWAGILDPGGFRLSQYAPLAQATFFFDRLIWGDHVGGYRLTSCLLHATTGLMLWYLLRRLAMPGAIVVALLFVAHPMTVESVSLLTERRTILATLFGLASTFLLLRAAGAIAPAAGVDPAKAALPDDPLRLYAMSAVLFVLGLFAHPVIALVPVAALLVVWWRRASIDPMLVGVAIALAIGGCAMLGFDSSIERENNGVPADQWRRDVTSGGDLALRAQLAGRGVAFYATKIAVPFPIKSIYARPTTPNDAAFRERFLTDEDKLRIARAQGRIEGGSGEDELTPVVEPTTAPATTTAATRAAERYVPPADGRPLLEPDVSPGNLVGWLPLVAVVAVLVALAAMQRRIGRGPIVAASAFVLCLLPILGFLDLGWMWDAFVADRGAYLASIPLLAGIVALATPYLAAPEQRAAMVSTVAVILVAYVGIAANVSRRYADAADFWYTAGDVRRGNPRSETARLGYAVAMLQRNPPNLDVAMQELENARRLRPSDPAVQLAIGAVHEYLRNPGNALNSYIFLMQNFPEDARGFLAAADLSRRIADARPTDPAPRRDALRYYRAAVALEPRNADAQMWLGLTAFEAAARLPDKDPQIPDLVQEAAVAFDHAVENDPYDPDKLIRIARTSIAMGKYAYAANLLRTALTYGTERADAYELIGDAAIGTGDANGAEAAIRRSIEVDPDVAGTRLKYGALLQSQGQLDEAKLQLLRALELDPNNAEAKARLAQVEAGDTGVTATRPTTRP